jgi:Tfp pilus assembly protein PilF
MMILSSMRVECAPATRALLCAASLLWVGCRHVPTDEEIERSAYARDLGISAMHKQDYRGALEELLRGEKLNPEDAELQYALGLTYFTGFQGHTAEAEAHLRKAMALRENYSDAENALGNVLMSRNECDKAIPYFEKAMANLLWATPYLAEQNLGWCLYKTGKTDQALGHLKNAVNIQPSLCGGYDYLARIYADKQQDADVVLWLTRYVTHCDTEKVRPYLSRGQLSGVFYRLGNAHLRANDKDAARAAFATCTERFPAEDVATECRKNLALLE